MSEFWEGALHQPGNLNSLQKASATSSCQLKSAFVSCVCWVHWASFFFSCSKRFIFVWFIFLFILLPDSFQVHISILFACNLEGFYGKWFRLDVKDHSVFHTFQSPCPRAQWELDWILKHLVIFTAKLKSYYFSPVSKGRSKSDNHKAVTTTD